MRYFGKRYRLQVDDFRFEGLDIRFAVERTLKPSPNNATITIRNLNPTHRKQLQELDEPFVRLEAGWADGIWEVFQGNLRDVTTHRTGTTWETVITSGDGEKVIRNARLALSVGPGASVSQLVKAIVSSMGLVIEDAAAAHVEDLAFLKSGATSFGEGVALTGPAADALDELLEGTGSEWSIQAGEVRIVPVGKAIAGPTVLLSSKTNIIGSPEPGNKGITEVSCLLHPGIDPGRAVEVRSEHVNGVYRIERVSDEGDTMGADWLHRCDLREVSA